MFEEQFPIFNQKPTKNENDKETVEAVSSLEIEKNPTDSSEQEVGMKKIQSFLSERKKIHQDEEEKKLSEELLRPFREGKYSLKEAFNDIKIAPLVAEALRIILIKETERKIKTDNYSTENNYEFIFNDLAGSLDAIDRQLKGDGFDEPEDDPGYGKIRYRNNILYVMSEGYASSKIANIDEWLNNHKDQLEKASILHTTSDDMTDHISEYTFRNIITRTEYPELREYALETVAEKDNTKKIQIKPEYLFINECFSRTQEDMAKFFISKLGLDESIIKKWREAKILVGKGEEGQEIFMGSYGKNIEAARMLEEKQPGSPKILYEKFGIANFCRYRPETLLRQIEIDGQNTPYGVVIFPEADWNGAFFQNSFELEKMRKQLLKGGYETRIIEAASQFEMSKRLSGFNKKYSPGGHKIDFLIIGGHGTESTVALGKEKRIIFDDTPPPLPDEFNSDSAYQNALAQWKKEFLNEPTHKSGINLRNTMTANDIKENRGKGIRRAAEEWFDKNAPVIFISCGTGIEGGIAQTASKELGFSTVGPDRPTSLNKINVHFDDEGKPKFDVEYSESKFGIDKSKKAETIKYFSGEKEKI